MKAAHRRVLARDPEGRLAHARKGGRLGIESHLNVFYDALISQLPFRDVSSSGESIGGDVQKGAIPIRGYAEGGNGDYVWSVA